jgi:hypothetical protein
MTTTSNFIYCKVDCDVDSLLSLIFVKDDELKINSQNKLKFIWTKKRFLIPKFNKYSGYYGLYNMESIDTIINYILPFGVNCKSFHFGKSTRRNTTYNFIWIENPKNIPIEMTIGWIPNELFDQFNDCYLISEEFYNYIQDQRPIKKIKKNNYL